MILDQTVDRVSPATTDRGCSIELVQDTTGIDLLRTAWLELEAAVGNDRPIFFQSFGWVRHVSRQRLHLGVAGFQPLIAVWRRSGRVEAIWPLATRNEGGVRVAFAIDDPFGQFSCILARPGTAIAPLIESLMTELRYRRLADVLTIAKVLERSPLYAALADMNHQRVVEHGTVVVELGSATTEAAFHARLSKRTRKTLRNNWNRLADYGGHEHLVTTERCEVERIVRTSLDRRCEWMVLQGKTAPAFRDKAYLPTLSGLAATVPKVPMIGFELRSRGEMLALQWGFLHANRYYAYISARNLGLGDLSAGRLHLNLVIDACIERGIEVVELMSPASPYKIAMAGEVRPITDFLVPVTAKGRLWTDVWRRRVRPILKAAYGVTPSRLRSRINALLHQGAANGSSPTSADDRDD